jgi:acyl-ACP thioesterase
MAATATVAPVPTATDPLAVRTLRQIGPDAHTELIEPPADGRVFTQTARAGLADCAPSGRVRLDALARLLQDVAYADVEDAELADTAVWVVRRCRIRVERFPRFGERLTLHTFCSGIGRAWAERRTTIESVLPGGARASVVEAVALWVHLNPATLHPAPLSDRELEVYGVGAAGARKVSHRLRHPAPPAETDNARPWTFRATECDLADHINNAAYWAPLEDELLRSSEPDPDGIDVELEFRAPAQPGNKRILTSGDRRWIVDPGGELHASLLIAR